MADKIQFTQEHADMLAEIHRDISDLKRAVGEFMPQAEKALSSGPLAMIAGSLFRKP